MRFECVGRRLDTSVFFWIFRFLFRLILLFFGRCLTLGAYFYRVFTCRGLTFSGANYWEPALRVPDGSSTTKFDLTKYNLFFGWLYDGIGFVSLIFFILGGPWAQGPQAASPRMKIMRETKPMPSYSQPKNKLYFVKSNFCSGAPWSTPLGRLTN